MNNEDILIRMLIELNDHRKEGHGGYYHKSLLIQGYDNHTDGENDAELKAQYEQVYAQAVADELIEVCPGNDERCGISGKGIEMVDPFALRNRIMRLEQRLAESDIDSHK